jgi:hypothetical protein
MESEYRRFLKENHCISDEMMDTMSESELEYQYTYWNIVLN